MPYRSAMPPEKLAFAKMLRKRATSGERLLWARIRKEKLGVRFRRQAPMLGWIVDFYCPSRRLVVEVDGFSHIGRERQDAYRDRVMNRHGMSVVRIPDELVHTDIDRAIGFIQAAVR